MNDRQKIYEQFLKDEKERQLKAHSKQINVFKQNCLKLGIALEDKNFTYVEKVGVVAEYPSIVSTICPEPIKDKEGLFNFGTLIRLFKRRVYASGILFGDWFALMAHPHFRRGYHIENHFSPRFIDLFWSYTDPLIDLYVSLDYDRVRVNLDNLSTLEFDTWFGAKFTKDIGLIKDTIVKLRPPVILDDFLIKFYFESAYSLDIKWETKKNIKSFQAEEFKLEEVIITKEGIEYYPVRYVHAEFDPEQGLFRHFDGAIHFYTREEYFKRRDSDFNYNSKNSSQIKTYSEKLFKMNGQIKVETWIEFTCHFFSGNPLILEYFDGEYPEHILIMLDAVRKNETTDN